MTFGDPAGFLCVYVGRISEEKRLDILIEAIKKLSGARKTYLAVVGDGPLAEKYASLHGAEQGVYCKPRFLSHPELAEVYASADVHVSASEFETLGNTVLEAFACGLPVVVPRTQGFEDTVRHDQTGYLFRPKDGSDAALFLQKLKDDRELLQRLGQEGLKEVKAYTYATVVADLLHWYRRGVARRAKQSVVMLGLKFVVVALTVTLAVVMHAVYDWMVKCTPIRILIAK